MIDLSSPDAGERIREARDRLGVTQADLARICGIRSATLSAVENGNDARMSTLRTIRAKLEELAAKKSKRGRK